MKDLKGSQPKQLYPLFFTELWERFGFYLVQTILILYLTKALRYTDDRAYLLYGTFNSMLYLTPFIGGYLADRFLGFQRSVLLGGIFLCFGYLLMAVQDPKALFFGMSIVIIGNGFFKPNVSSLVGTLYEKQDPRRDGGFTIFYMGINIGSMLPPIFIGAFVAAYSWKSGFSLASLGMVFALITFVSAWKWFRSKGAIPASSPLHRGKTKFHVFLGIGCVLAILLFVVLFHFPKEADFFLIICSLAILGTILFFLFKEREEERKKLWACLILIAVSIGFWAIYMQTFSSLMLFADRNMEKQIFGIPINAEFTLFFNPFFIIAMSPILSTLWIRLEKKRMNPSTPTKFSLGILCIALGFFALWLGTHFFSESGIASPWWLILSYFIQTLGELLLSPIGLAMITRLAPSHLVGTMMGVWFLTLAAAFAVGGALSTIANVPKDTSVLRSLQIYDHAFWIYGCIALALAIFSFALIPYLKRLIQVPSTPIQTPKK